MADGLDLRAARSAIHDFADATGIEFNILEREFRLLKLYIIQTAIHNVMRDQRNGDQLLTQYDKWLRKTASDPELGNLVSLWEARKKNYDNAWVNDTGEGTRNAIGKAFSLACGDSLLRMSDFAGDMLLVLLSDYINRLRTFRISAD